MVAATVGRIGGDDIGQHAASEGRRSFISHHHIIANAAGEGVVAAAADEHIVAGTGDEHIVARCSWIAETQEVAIRVELGIAVIACQVVPAGAACDHVIATATEGHAHTAAELHAVITARRFIAVHAGDQTTGLKNNSALISECKSVSTYGCHTIVAAAGNGEQLPCVAGDHVIPALHHRAAA